MTETTVSPLTDAEYEVLSILASGRRLLAIGDRIGDALKSLALRGFVMTGKIPTYDPRGGSIGVDYEITEAGRAAIDASEDQLIRDLIEENNKEYERRQQLFATNDPLTHARKKELAKGYSLNLTLKKLLEGEPDDAS